MYSLSGSSVHGILQARIVQWVAISFSRGSSQPRDRSSISRSSPASTGRFFTAESPGKPILRLERSYLLIWETHPSIYLLGFKMNLKPYPYSDEPPTGPSDIDGHSCRFPSPDHVHKVSLSLLFQVWRQLSGSTESPASFWNLLSTQPKWPCPLQHGYRAACPGYHLAFPLRVFASCSFMCLCLNPKENLGSLGGTQSIVPISVFSAFHMFLIYPHMSLGTDF